jgi:hypothetical protein
MQPMPTPFTHLETAQRLLDDPDLPHPLRAALRDELSAFLLGNVAADARISGAMRREDTHFYVYDQPMVEPPWRVMLTRHPALQTPRTPAQRVFLAGYVAHLSMDEIWTVAMLGPHFVQHHWAAGTQRFLMLHILLIHMDERDYARLLPWQPAALTDAQPDDWLPFMSDAVLRDWRDFVGEQIKPGGVSQTLQVFGGRIHKSPLELRAILDSSERMQTDLWVHVAPDTLTAVEDQMYRRAREQLCMFWEGYPVA